MNANINRRAFLKASGAATGGLLVAVYLPDIAGAIARVAKTTKAQSVGSSISSCPS